MAAFNAPLLGGLEAGILRCSLPERPARRMTRQLERDWAPKGGLRLGSGPYVRRARGFKHIQGFQNFRRTLSPYDAKVQKENTLSFNTPQKMAAARLHLAGFTELEDAALLKVRA